MSHYLMAYSFTREKPKKEKQKNGTSLKYNLTSSLYPFSRGWTFFSNCKSCTLSLIVNELFYSISNVANPEYAIGLPFL